MASRRPPDTTDHATMPLRVRLSGPADRSEHAAWALEALLARAGVRDWLIVQGDEPVDLDWGGTGAPTVLDLPSDAQQWDFQWDREPDADRDPLAFTFWWLARVEERLAPADAFDEHGRFRADRSALARQGDPLAAPVDELARTLAPRLASWQAEVDPAGPSWRVVATHDIDLPVRWTHVGRRRAMRRLRDELRRGRLVAAARSTVALLASPLADALGDPWHNFAAISKLEASCGARSTSYLLVGNHAPEDGDEELHERGRRYVERRDLRLVDGADDRIGLHGSYSASDTDGRLAIERDELERRLGVPALDHRFHYLRHRPIDAWPLLDALGMRSDASLGYAEHPGFRAGTGHPFRAWDHGRDRTLDLVVIPLAVMDASYDERYLALGRSERVRHAERVLDRIRELGGSASLLVHNDRLCNLADDGWTRQYRRLLRRIEQRGGAACTAGAAAQAYLDRIPSARRATTR